MGLMEVDDDQHSDKYRKSGTAPKQWTQTNSVSVKFFHVALLSGIFLWMSYAVKGSFVSPGQQGPWPWSPAGKEWVSFGIIADVQYADVDDGLSAMGVPRHYRHSLEVLSLAVSAWQKDSLAFVAVLGDQIDMKTTQTDSSRESLDKVLKEMRNLSKSVKVNNGMVHFTLGNHDLASLPRDYLRSKLGVPAAINPHLTAYYDFIPLLGVRCVVLDTYDISVLGWSEASDRWMQASELLRSQRSTLLGTGESSDVNSSNWNSPMGSRTNMRWSALNGAVSKVQLSWLDTVLSDADTRNQRAIIFSHIPVLPGAQSVLCGGLCLAWNYDEVLQVLDRHPCVGAVIAGHDHSGGYARSMHGVHHITLEGVIETPLDSVSFATVDIHDRGLMLRGFGRARTAWFPFTDIRAIHGSL